MATNGSDNDVPRRLVKTWLPAELVRRMDSAVLNSEGAYLDRTDFVRDGITSLLDELRHEHPEKRSLGEADDSGATGDVEAEPVRFGDWLNGEIATLPPAPGPETNFGLHNRDLPTIWALDWIGRLVSRSDSPIGWGEMADTLLPAAWAEARRLRQRSVARGARIKAEAGFPTQMKKREAVERRFLQHFVADPKGRGPLLVFRLIGVEDDAVAPTDAALTLVRSLVDSEVDQAPPFSADAWRAFRGHLEREAGPELEMWQRVLRIVADEPTRQELVGRCDWWAGSQSETNANSYVARGREWGLVEPALVDGQYRLTELGRAEVKTTSRES